jgi:hypothetical protein
MPYVSAVLADNSLFLKNFRGHELKCCSFVTFVPFVVETVRNAG